MCNTMNIYRTKKLYTYLRYIFSNIVYCSARSFAFVLAGTLAPDGTALRE